MKKILFAILSFLLLPVPVLGALNTHSIDLELSGSQYLSASDSSSLSPTGDITIEACINYETLAVYAVNSSAIVSKKVDNVSQGSYELYVEEASGGSNQNFVGFRYTGSGNLATGDTHKKTPDNTFSNADLGDWKHIAVTADVSAQDIHIYVDGVDQSLSTISTNASAIFDGTASVSIGAGAQGSGQFFDGKIDEVRIWDHVRTSGEINADMAETIDPASSGLLGYWRLDNSLLDETANNNDLTNTNSASFVASPCFTGTADPPAEVTTSTIESAGINDFWENYGDSLLWILGSLLFLAFIASLKDVIVHLITWSKRKIL